jgi:RimJ/RimL family protein N-acetyltransferase
MEIRSKNARIYLKSLGIEDADAVAEKANDYDIAYNIDEWGKFPYPYTRTDALAFIESATAAQMSGLGIHFGIRLVKTGEIIGTLGLSQIDMKDKKSNFGYWIGKKFWNNGYATEAGSLIIEYGFGTLHLHRIEAGTFAFNKASVRVLEKLGFKKEGVLRDTAFHKDKFVDGVIYALLDNDYKGKISITIM